jgi:uncharacterized membrane protein
MTATAAPDAQEARIAALEERLAATNDELGNGLGAHEARLRRLELRTGSAAAPAAVDATPARVESSPRRGGPAPGTGDDALWGGRGARARGASVRSRPARAARPSGSLGDAIGGRVLAWVGGAATLLGIAMFLALAISHGWIGEQARVLLAGAGSIGLLAAGRWLHDHRGRTEAAVAIVGTAVAGLFATLIVASSVYELIPGLVALAGAIAVGAIATVLATRWAGRAIAGLGLIGALSAPALVGAPEDWPTLAMLLATAGFSLWLAARQRWGWLTLATVIVCAPQWAVPMLEGQTAGEDVLVLVVFASLGLAGAVAAARRQNDGEEPGGRAAIAALVLSASATALVGRIALGEVAGATTGGIWLGSLACAHLLLGTVAPPRLAIGPRMRSLLIALGVALADVAFALSFHGIVLAVGWSASAVALAAATRRLELDDGTEALRELGVGAQVSLALVRGLIDVPPGDLMSGQPEVAGLLSLAAVAAGCMACAGLTGRRHGAARTAFGGAGLTAVAYLTATTLDGPALSAAWAAEAAALLQLENRAHDRLARSGGLAFAGLATLYSLTAVAPPTALAAGDADLAASAIAIAALAGLAWRAGRLLPRGAAGGHAASIAAGGALLYLASLAVATLPQGQVALSALWGLAGVCALVGGLRLNAPIVRNAALGLLFLTVGKVFLYDLSTLTSIARVVSFLVLGLLLLAGAYAYQRLRPPPRPDMRTVHPSQR